MCPMSSISVLNHRQDMITPAEEAFRLYEQECLAGDQEEYGILHKIYQKIKGLFG